MGQRDFEGSPTTEAGARGVYVTPVSGENRELARISEQLEHLKRLMVVQLLASGVQTAHVAKALRVHPSRISQMFPVREIQKVAKRGSRGAESDG